MQDCDRQLDGVLVLRDRITGEVQRVGVMIVIDAENVTYTAQSIDREQRRTIHSPRSECPFFLDAMQCIAETVRASR